MFHHVSCLNLIRLFLEKAKSTLVHCIMVTLTLLRILMTTQMLFTTKETHLVSFFLNLYLWKVLATSITSTSYCHFSSFVGSEADDLILAFHRGYHGGALHGILKSHNDYFFSIEFVEYSLHAFKTLKNFESTSRQLSLGRPNTLSAAGYQVRSPENTQLDNTTIVTVYIKFYYTEMFYDSTDDVNGFIDKLISQLNKDLKVNIPS